MNTVFTWNTILLSMADLLMMTIIIRTLIKDIRETNSILPVISLVVIVSGAIALIKISGNTGGIYVILGIAFYIVRHIK